jgi:hypothetical protein
MSGIDRQRVERLGRVAVLYGGRSAERAVSLMSGAEVLAGLRSSGVDAHGIDTGEAGLRPLLEGGFDRVFIVLHGRGGEDGTLQGALETLGLPYTGSGVLGSALCMDKWRSKRLWAGADLPTPPFTLIRQRDELEQVADQVGFPMVIKPSREGSSIGISIRWAKGLVSWSFCEPYPPGSSPRMITNPPCTGVRFKVIKGSSITFIPTLLVQTKALRPAIEREAVRVAV